MKPLGKIDQATGMHKSRCELMESEMGPVHGEGDSGREIPKFMYLDQRKKFDSPVERRSPHRSPGVWELGTGGHMYLDTLAPYSMDAPHKIDAPKKRGVFVTWPSACRDA